MPTSENKIIVRCSDCSKSYGLKSDKYAGKKIRCPNCKTPIYVDPAAKQPGKTHSGSFVKKVAFAALAAGICMGIYFRSDIRAWYIGAESGEKVKLDPQKVGNEQYLADSLTASLEFTEQEKREIDNILTELVNNHFPGHKPKSEISKDQQRQINRDAREASLKIDKILKKLGERKKIHIKIAEENQFEQILLAYQWNRKQSLLNIWIKAILYKLQTEPDGVDTPSLLDSLCSLRPSNFPEHPGLKAIISYSYKKIKEKAAHIKTKADAFELLLSLRYLSKTPQTQALSEKCLKTALDKRTSFGNLNEQGEGFRYLMEYIRLENGNVDKALLEFAHEYAQDIAILLEADGCLPQINGVHKRINLREPVYWASKMFKRDDFRYIAYGGLRMTDAYPPSVCSVFLDELSKCVMRSTWNICYHINREMRSRIGDDQTSLTMDIKTGEISVYGYNHPLCIIRNDAFGKLKPEKTVWRNEMNRDLLHIETSSRIVDIHFIKAYNTWIIKEKILKSNPSQEILFYRSEINEIDKNTLVSEHYVRLTWSQDKQMGNKQAGNVYLSSGNTPFSWEKTEPVIEGCYYKAQRKLTDENELIITALPYVCPEKYRYRTNPRYLRRNIRFSYVTKRPGADYACYHMKRKEYHNIIRGEDISDKKPQFVFCPDKKQVASK